MREDGGHTMHVSDEYLLDLHGPYIAREHELTRRALGAVDHCVCVSRRDSEE